MRFNHAGLCVLVPSEPNHSHPLKVRSYPVQEQGPFVWIWMGKPQDADPALLPKLEWPVDSAYLKVGGYAEVKCDFMVLLENFMDLTHFPYVHDRLCQTLATPETFMADLSFTTAPPRAKGNSVSMTTRVVLPPIELERRSLNLATEYMLEKSSEYLLTLPLCLIQHVNVTAFSKSSSVLSRHFIRGALCATAIAPNRCHFWWETVQDYGAHLAEQWQAEYDVGLKEDIDILEAVQSAIDNDRAYAREALVKSDGAVIEMRRVLRSMLRAEREAERAKSFSG